MKKRLTFCGVLCLALALFCGTALAADAQVTPTNPETVQVEKVDKGEDVAFKVTKTSGVQEGQLYLIMIQEGDDATAKPKPTKDNLYYLNVEPASAFPLEAYPKDLKADSSYVVYLSDYSAGSDGAAQGVALISTKETSTPGGDNPGTDTPGGDNPGGETGDILYGDVNGDKAVDDLDEMVLARYNAGWDDYGPGLKNNVVMANADVNRDNGVDDLDEMILSRYNAGWDGYSLPYSK